MAVEDKDNGVPDLIHAKSTNQKRINSLPHLNIISDMLKKAQNPTCVCAFFACPPNRWRVLAAMAAMAVVLALEALVAEGLVPARVELLSFGPVSG